MDATECMAFLSEEGVRHLQATETESRQERAASWLKHCDAVASGLVGLGLMDEHAGELALQALRSRLVDEGLIDSRTVLMGRLGFEVPAGPADWSLVPGTSAQPKALSVLPLVRHIEGLDGAAWVVLLSLDFWTDRVVLRFAMGAPEGTERQGPPAWAWVLKDDAGTRYERFSSRMSGLCGSSVWMEEIEFHPAVDPGADCLVLSVRQTATPPHPEPPGVVWRAHRPLGGEVVSVRIRIPQP